MNKFNGKLAWLAGATLVLGSSLAASSAQALPVDVLVKETSMSADALSTTLSLPILQSTKNDKVKTDSYNVNIGSFNISIENLQTKTWTSALAFCVDPWNWSSTSPLSYLSDNLANVSATAKDSFDVRMLALHKDEIGDLYSTYYRSTLGNAGNAAAFQLALWEIVSDGAIGKLATTNKDIWNTSQSWLQNLENPTAAPGTDHYLLTTYYVNRSSVGTTGQNYLVASLIGTTALDAKPLPEPSSMLLLGAGLLGVALSRRRGIAARGGE